MSARLPLLLAPLLLVQCSTPLFRRSVPAYPEAREEQRSLQREQDRERQSAAYERGQAAQNAKNIASGHVRPLADEGLKPLAEIPPAIQAKLAANEHLMTSLGLEATPAMVWRDASGAVQTRTGAPPSALATVLGPR